jgi:hypothetical protein
MIRSFGLFSGIGLLSICIANQSLAQTANVDFSGTVSPAVTINASSSGTWNGSSGLDISTPNLIRVPSLLTLSASTGFSFTINSITDNGSNLAAGQTFNNFDLIRARIEYGGNLILQSEISPSGNYPITNPLGVVSPVQAGPISNKQYDVYLTLANNSNVLPAGTYKVRVTLTLTPQ